MDRIDRALDRLCAALMWGGGLAAVLMMLHIAAHVIGRRLFDAPINNTVEIVSAYYMVAIAFLPLAWIARSEGHIIVELFTRGLSASWLRRVDAVTTLVTLVYVAVFAWMSGVAAVEQTAKAEVWESAQGFTVVWPSRWFLPAGLAVMAVYLAWRLVRDLRGAGAR